MYFGLLILKYIHESINMLHSTYHLELTGGSVIKHLPALRGPGSIPRLEDPPGKWQSSALTGKSHWMEEFCWLYRWSKTITVQRPNILQCIFIKKRKSKLCEDRQVNVSPPQACLFLKDNSFFESLVSALTVATVNTQKQIPYLVLEHTVFNHLPYTGKSPRMKNMRGTCCFPSKVWNIFKHRIESLE